ncbi:MAG: DUF3237 domain-containing protein [Eubacteriales bacterium]|nr:DUF3237 domain-containing protein [Eubacteriales bacterium]
MEPALKKQFEIRVKVDKPVVVGQDAIAGRRQLIPITEGTVIAAPGGFDPEMNGIVVPGGVDSQVIRPDGRCELSARYGVRLNNGASFYIENNGIRTVPAECVQAVLNGEFVDPDLYYFCTTPTFEVYDERLNWLKNKLFICSATRLPDEVILGYYTVD